MSLIQILVAQGVLFAALLVCIGWFLARRSWIEAVFWVLLAIGNGASFGNGIIDEAVSTVNAAAGFAVVRRTLPATLFLIVTVISFSLALLVAIFWLGRRRRVRDNAQTAR
jgi:hypothetical protein